MRNATKNISYICTYKLIMKSAKFHYNISMTSRDVAKKNKNKKRNLLHSVVPLSRMLNVEHTAGESSVGLIWVIDRVESRWVGESVSCWAAELLSSWAVGEVAERRKLYERQKARLVIATTRRLDSTFWPISVEMSCVLIVSARERGRGREGETGIA